MNKLWMSVQNIRISKNLDFRVRLFNVLGIAGVVISLFVAGLGIFERVSAANILVNLLAAVLAIGLLTYVNRSGRYQLGYMITIIVVFLFFFPLLFFATGGYHSGMPSFFILAIIFTVLMMDGRKMFVMVGLEALIYIGICLFAFRFPNSISAFHSEKSMMIDVIVGFLAVSLTLGVCMYIQLKLYNEQQRQLAKQNEALGRLNRLKTEFLGNVSHELKTPLAVMMGVAQNTKHSLEKRDVADELIGEMKLLASEAERLSLMVSQVLDITRIEEGSMSIHLQNCSIREIIQITIDTYYPQLKKNGNRLAICVDDELPEVSADAGRVTQVLVNLLQNAIRHTLNGTITISAKLHGAFVCVMVKDTGEGILPERLPFIFERFKSHDSAKKAHTGTDTGTGLGLFICKHIVEAHGGEITVTSEPGGGTNAAFTIPVRP